MEKLDRNILKALTIDNINGLDFAYSFSEKLFTKDIQTFARILIHYMRSYKSLPTRRVITEYHNSNDNLVNYINKVWDELDKFDYNTQEFKYDLDKLKTRYKKWSLQKLQDKLTQANLDSPDFAIKDLALGVQEIRAVDRGRTFKQLTAAEYLAQFEEEYEAKERNPEATELIKTGFSAIDQATDGMGREEMLIVGGETNAGKSIFLNSLAVNMWKQGNTIDTPYNEMEKGYNVLYFSLEMKYKECFARFLAALAGIPQRGLVNASLDNEQKERVRQASKFIKEYPFQFDIVDFPRGLNVDEMELRYNDALLKYRPDIVVVDYLGLMEGTDDSKDQDWLKLGKLAGELHEFSRVFNVVMLTAAQLTDIKRNSKSKDDEENKKVGLHRIGRSSHIMHHANVGIQIETRKDEDNYADMSYHVIKNRRGPHVGNATLRKQFANGYLIDLPYEAKQLNMPLPNNDISSKIREIQEKAKAKL